MWFILIGVGFGMGVSATFAFLNWPDKYHKMYEAMMVDRSKPRG
jgi:hypothetical protein